MHPSDFVHLHLHSDYSIKDSINSIPRIVETVKGHGQVAVALTDHGTMAGTYAFYKECKKQGIKPIIGLEAYYMPDAEDKGLDQYERRYYHLVLLAMNNKGLKNLFQLTKHSATQGFYYKPRISNEMLRKYGSDLIVTTACMGGRATKLAITGEPEEALAQLIEWKDMFGDRLYLEIQPHLNEDQRIGNEFMINAASQVDAPLVLAADAHYPTQKDGLFHEYMLAIKSNMTMSNPKRQTYNGIDVHITSTPRIYELAEQLNLPTEAIRNTRVITDRIDSEDYFEDVKNRYTRFTNMPEGMKSWEALEILSKNMLTDLLSPSEVPEKYKARLNEELKIIKRVGFSDYMLLEWFMISEIEKMGVWVGPGRGSSAGSLVAYALGITKVDPIKYNLLFSRFLNEGRAATSIPLTRAQRQLIESL